MLCIFYVSSYKFYIYFVAGNKPKILATAVEKAEWKKKGNKKPPTPHMLQVFFQSWSTVGIVHFLPYSFFANTTSLVTAEGKVVSSLLATC
jgi:hypothetical protein